MFGVPLAALMTANGTLSSATSSTAPQSVQTYLPFVSLTWGLSRAARRRVLTVSALER